MPLTKYIMRLDDACPHWDAEKWKRVEFILDNHGIKPLVGLIPMVEDPVLVAYPEDDAYWNRVEGWRKKGWELALHGCTHVYATEDGGLNPVNRRSEFAGLSLEDQREKISRGVSELAERGIHPRVFFAPSHTFDLNTLEALRIESNIRVVSDTVAFAPYSKYGFTFVPQQSGRVRSLKMPVVTFCYHPNIMCESDFNQLETFLSKNYNKFVPFPTNQVKNGPGVLVFIARKLYFARRA